MLMKPAVGRMVHFYTAVPPTKNNGQGAGPYSATIVQTFEAGGEVTYCNLKVLVPFGDDFYAGSIPEKDGKFDFGNGIYWEWPPRL